MKIGVFGDSFASPSKLNPSPSWLDILSAEYDITNFAIEGSNLFYSAEQIKKVHEDYDKLILVVTQPGRLKISNWIPVDSIKDKFITGKFDYKFLNKNNSSITASYLEAGNQYYTYLQDTTYDNYVHDLIIKDICNTRPDVILIPAFLDSWIDIKGYSMHHIFLKENTAWNLDWKATIAQFTDTRNCHMIAENNQIFATKAKEWLNGKHVHINLDDFVTTTNKDFYLKPK
jgi:hypothetical protein